MNDDSSAPGPIDWAHLARQTGGDQAFAEEILGLFAAHAQQLAVALATAAEPRSWRDAAHSLKGSARGIGAFDLGLAAEAAEALDPASAGASAVLFRLEQLLGDVLTTIAATPPAARVAPQP